MQEFWKAVARKSLTRFNQLGDYKYQRIYVYAISRIKIEFKKSQIGNYPYLVEN